MVRREDIVIENGKATWSISMAAPIQGTYTGTFKFRCILTPLQLIEADRDYRELLGPNPSLATGFVDNLAYALSQLRQRVISAPPFWNDGTSRFGGGSVEDNEVILEVLAAAEESELKYRDELKQAHNKAMERLKKSLDEKYRQDDEAQAKAKEQEQTNEELDAMNLSALQDLPMDTPPPKKGKKK